MDKICVVTGGTGGIGRAAVRMMSERCHVLFCDVNQEKIDAFIQELAAEGIKADGVTCDVSDRAQCDRLAQTAASMGKVIGVIHLAGLTPGFAKHPDIVRVDCIGTMNINKAFFHVMEGGCIMDICSCVAHFVPKDRYPTDIFELALTDKKLFQEKLTEFVGGMGDAQTASNMAYTFGRCFVYWYGRKCAYVFGREKGIRIVTVSIGFVETPMSRADLGASSRGGNTFEEKLAPQISYSAFGRAGTPEEVAYLFATLLDERNTYLSGCDIYFDNGCDAAGYHGQPEPYDPSVNPYHPD